MTILELLESFKSAKVLEGDAAHKHLRSRTVPGDADQPLDSKYAKYKEHDDGQIQVFKASPTGYIKDLKRVDPERAKILAGQRGVEWRDVYADRVLMQWGSDQRVDRHGDIVLQNFDFSEFEQNPAMPFNHNWDQLPVGVHLDWLVTNRVARDYTGPALLLTSLFAAADEMPPDWGDSLFRLISAGMLRANSIGFIPGKVIVINDEAERDKLGLGRWGDILDENMLLENSPTLLGANQGAMTILNTARATGELKANDITVLREMARRSLRETPDVWVEEDSRYLQMAKLLFPREHFAKATDIEEPLFEAEIEEPEEKATEGDEILEIASTDLPEETKASGEEMILAKIQQLIGLVEMGLLAMQAQLDGIADALMDEEGDASAELASARKTAIALIRELRDHDLEDEGKAEDPPTLASYLANIREVAGA